MSLQVEKLEKNMVKLTIEASAEELDAAIEKAYQKNKGKMSVQGFRKGKAPRAIIEKLYGAAIFYEDAANALIPEVYDKAVKESDLDIVSQPDINVVQIEKGKPFIFTAEVAVKPEVTLGDYKGIEVDKIEVSISEEEINAELDRIREQNARTITVEDRAIENNDIAVIDFEGFVDGNAFEGGTGTDYSLVIGSHSFIDTFEEQLIGKKTGEEAEINVTFPEDYQAEELAGKPAMFKVTVKEIKVKELPELNDEFAQDVSEFESLEEYKADVKKNLEEKKHTAAMSAKEEAVVDAVIDNATMEIPEAMIQTQVRQMADDFARRIQQQGLSLEQYFQFTGMDAQKFLDSLKPQALKRIQSRLVLEAIAKAENIEVSEEELDKELEGMAAAYKMELDKLKELMSDNDKETMSMDIAVQKAVDLIAAAAVEK